MSLLAKASRAIRGGAAAPPGIPLQDSDPRLAEIFGSAPDTYSGKRVTRDRALSMVSVWRCVELLSTGVASLPFHVLTTNGEGRRVELETPTWLRTPQQWQAPMDFWHRVMVSLTVEGNAFLWTQRDKQGRIVGLQVLDPHAVYIEETPDKSDVRFQVDGQYYDRSWILWIPNFTVAWQLRGVPPIEVARQAIDLGLTVEEYGARFFHQGTSMSGVIEHPGTPSPDEAKMLREMFRKKHTGINQSHAIGILTGAAKWTNITITPEQAQFLETRKFQNEQVALLFGIPAYMVNPSVSSSWGSGVEEQNAFFTVFSLQNYVTRIEQYVTTFLLPGRQFFKFNTDARMRPKTQERYTAYAAALNAGWMNVDEVRALEDMEPVPDGLGQTFYRPLNYAPLGVGPYQGTDPNADGIPTEPAKGQ